MKATWVVRYDDTPKKITEAVLGARAGARWPELIAANPHKLTMLKANPMTRGYVRTFQELAEGEVLWLPEAWSTAVMQRVGVGDDPDTYYTGDDGGDAGDDGGGAGDDWGVDVTVTPDGSTAQAIPDCGPYTELYQFEDGTWRCVPTEAATMPSCPEGQHANWDDDAGVWSCVKDETVTPPKKATTTSTKKTATPTKTTTTPKPGVQTTVANKSTPTVKKAGFFESPLGIGLALAAVAVVGVFGYTKFVRKEPVS